MDASLKKLSDEQLINKLIELVATTTGFPETHGELAREKKEIKIELLRRLKRKTPKKFPELCIKPHIKRGKTERIKLR
jgi:hypothetical protein